MANKTRDRIVPYLRFQEFSDDWGIKRAKELFTNKRKKGIDSLPIYSVTIENGLVPRDSLERKTENVANSEDNLAVAPNDIAYNMMRMWQGAFGIAKQPCMVSPAYIVLKPTSSACSEFFIHFFNRRRSAYLFTAYSYGLTKDRLRLYYKDFASIKFAVPDLTEQRKIADFLTAIDTKIQQLTRKKELLEHYKKGVMQKIFSREIRFKDENGNDYPEWEEKRLGILANLTMGQSPDSSTYNTNFNGIPLLQGNADISQRRSCPRIWTTNPLKISHTGDILLSVRAPVGYISINNHNASIGRGLCAIRFKKDNVQEFYYHFLISFETKWLRIEQGSTFTAVTNKDVRNLLVPFPVAEEQNKIAIFFSIIDRKIEYVQNQLSSALTYKSGLLQKMFV